MDSNSREIYKNIGEAVVDTAMTVVNTMTFGVSTNLMDLGDKVLTHYRNSQRIHALKQLKYFYDTPSRLLGANMQVFKEEHTDHEEIILDLLKTLDLTVHKKQSEMLGRLLECYILNEIDTDRFHHLKYVIVKLDQYLLNKLESYLPEESIANIKFDLNYKWIGIEELLENSSFYTQDEITYGQKVGNFLGTKQEKVHQEFITFEFYEPIEIPLTMDLDKMPQQDYKPTKLFLWFITNILKDNN